jgi:hypothetical protein
MTESGRVFIVRGVLNGAAQADLIISATEAMYRTIRLHDEAFIAVVKREVVSGGISRAAVEVRLSKAEWTAKNGLVDRSDDDDSDLPL